MEESNTRFSIMLQDAAKSSSILILGKMVSTAIRVIGVVIIARLLGSTSYGIITIAMVPINIAVMTLNNGVNAAMINSIVTSRVNENNDQISRTVLSGTIINLTIGITATVFIYTLSGYISTQIYHNPDLKDLIQILSLYILGTSLTTTANGALIGMEKMTHHTIIGILYSLLRTILGPILIFLGYGVIGATLGIGFSYLVSGLFAIILVYINLNQLSSLVKPEINDYKHIITYALPLFGANLLAGSMTHILKFILPLYVAAKYMGNFEVAGDFAILINFFLGPISIATFPLLAKLKPNDTMLETAYQKIIKYETLIAYPVSAAIISLSKYMIEILYGSKYSIAVPYIQITMLGMFFIGLGSSVNNTILNTQNQNKAILHKTIINLIIGIPLGFYLIPKIGVQGYLITNIITQIPSTIYIQRWINKKLDIKFDIINTLKILGSTIGGYIICELTLSQMKWTSWPALFLGGGIFTLVYVLSILLTGAFTSKDINDIKTITTRNKHIKYLSDPVFNLMLKIAQ